MLEKYARTDQTGYLYFYKYIMYNIFILYNYITYLMYKMFKIVFMFKREAA